jgi:hypothetical protein
MTTSNKDLEKISKLLKLDPFFKGVYLEDELNNVRAESGFYIINFEKTDQVSKVGHWVLCVHTNGGGSLYFDSFGCDAPVLIKNFIQKINVKYAYNTKDLQDLNSDLCGFYCICCAFYIYRVTNKGKPYHERLNDFTNLFSDNTLENGFILKNLMKNFINSPSLQLTQTDKKYFDNKLFTKK